MALSASETADRIKAGLIMEAVASCSARRWRHRRPGMRSSPRKLALSSVVANSDLFGEAFSIDATEQLDGNVDVSISRARYNGRRKIIALNHPQSVAAPAESNTDMWLRSESHFIGVNSYEQ